MADKKRKDDDTGKGDSKLVKYLLIDGGVVTRWVSDDDK
jgi:hypothetical protein